MYAVEVRDHIMIAHSFKGALFGPAQALHGATFVVDVAFFREELTADGVVVDIGRAHEALKATLAPLNYQNLDELPRASPARTPRPSSCAGTSSTPWRRPPAPGALGPGSEGVERIRVTLHESACGAGLVRRPGRCLRPVFAVPGDLDAPTGGYAYARQAPGALPGCGVALRHLRLPGAFPHPTAADLAETAAARCARRARGRAADRRPRLRRHAGRAARRASGRPLVALVHHPLGLETGLAPERQAELLASEAAALARRPPRDHARAPLTARLLAAEFGVPADRIAVAEPGTEPARRARGTGAPVALLAVGAVSPRKGYDVLVGALARAAPTWIGASPSRAALERHPARRRVAAAAIAERGLCGADHACGRGRRGGAANALRPRRPLRLAVPLRGLRHGAGRGDGARPADRRLDRRRGGRDGAGRPPACKVPPGDVAALREALRAHDRRPRSARAAARRHPGPPAGGLPRWSDTAAQGRGGAAGRGAVSGFSAGLARPARARRPAARATRSFSPLSRERFRRAASARGRRSRLRHRLEPARLRAAPAARASDWTLVDHDPALLAAAREPARRLGGQQRARLGRRRCGSGRRPARRSPSASAGRPRDRARRRASRARPISSPRPRSSTSSRRSGSTRFAAEVARRRRGLLHGAHL